MVRRSVGKRLLELLVAAGPLRFTQMREGLDTSKHVLNYWRRRLLKKGLIERDGRLYSITLIGHAALKSEKLWNLVFSRKRIHHEERGLSFTPKLKLSPALARGYLPNIPYRISTFVSSDMELEKILDETSRMLELEGSHFLQLLVDEIARQHGLAALVTLRLIPKISHFEDIMWTKRAYDFNMVLVIEFLGRQWVESIAKNPGWTILLDQAKQADKQFLKGIRKAQKLAREAFKKQADTLLGRMLMDELLIANRRRQAFERNLKEHYEKLYLNPREDSDELFDSLVDHVKELILFIDPQAEVSNSEISQKLKELQSKKIFTIKTISLSGIEVPDAGDSEHQ